MEQEPHPDFDVVFLEVEGIESCHLLAERILNRTESLFTKTQGIRNELNKLKKRFGGIEVFGIFKFPEPRQENWQDLLQTVIGWICNVRPERRVLLILDELPYMLQKINSVAQSENKKHEAITLLDNFRALRQRHRNLRMIFAGSIGLHHVLKDLTQQTLPSEPFNNMEAVEIGPLEDCDAILLTEHLLSIEKISIVDDRDEVIRSIIVNTNNVPFYIERVISRLAGLGKPVSVAEVETTIQRQLTDDNDPWEMEHFRSRLEVYYQTRLIDASNHPVSEASLARAVLDHLVTANTPQSIDEIWRVIRSQFVLTDRQAIIQLLRSLTQDHYLICDSNKRYRFRFSLVQRWWKIAQDLS
jgi:hypothetical protein